MFISGYTEWVSTQEPIISIGWDWYLQVIPSGLRWTRVGLPSSNVMLLEEEGRDILATVVDALPWREQLPQIVAVRYA